MPTTASIYGHLALATPLQPPALEYHMEDLQYSETLLPTVPALRHAKEALLLAMPVHLLLGTLKRTLGMTAP